ncbi:ATP-binding cassette domain-containing protein [endosymbiont GvMRE of Glomus versiforme]|uniref:ATP-binding cassette domain-containing protein n=1 Tax=endosymbiont GvMRE of Glomus versiforme TaxID=2039283 RepID=UPI0015599FE0|nr:ATP-binding cassette domain-containing protein [endosymbiont GvMRE of Glomus versiforme]
MNKLEIFFSISWLTLINITSYIFTKKVLFNEKKYKKRLDREWVIINQERNNINLIESMGLDWQYKIKQEKITKNNEDLALSFNSTKSLSKSFPRLLADTFPFILLFISGNNFIGKNLLVFWLVLDKLIEILRCLWEYADYSSSLSRVNSFLALPEKNDNPSGLKLDKNLIIEAVHYQNVSFRYQEKKEWILKNYTRSFFMTESNHLIGENGTGKSTILYLLLGVIRPQEGRLIVKCKGGWTYNLHQDINLQHWRENNVAYVAHETLLEAGSTGQRQWTNLQNTLSTKSEAQIFLFDEASNALDSEKKIWFQQNLARLVRDKLVIYVKH